MTLTRSNPEAIMLAPAIELLKRTAAIGQTPISADQHELVVTLPGCGQVSIDYVYSVVEPGEESFGAVEGKTKVGRELDGQLTRLAGHVRWIWAAYPTPRKVSEYTRFYWNKWDFMGIGRIEVTDGIAAIRHAAVPQSNVNDKLIQRAFYPLSSPPAGSAGVKRKQPDAKWLQGSQFLRSNGPAMWKVIQNNVPTLASTTSQAAYNAIKRGEWPDVFADEAAPRIFKVRDR